MKIPFVKCYVKIIKLMVSSLRENIAVVPQDATLFSETIMTNLRYAKLTASKREVYEACKTAKIHDKIMSIPDSQFFSKRTYS
jgi:ABC-type multidrug transport system fused ATPase/permease subunit